MTPSEVFVETLVANGVTNVFGIVGSTNMDALDLLPAAGIRHIPPSSCRGVVRLARVEAVWQAPGHENDA